MLALIFGIIFCFTAQAADPNKAHNHNGVSQRFSDPKPVWLSHTERATLNKGKPVLKQVKGSDDGGRGIAIFDVNASEQIVWSVLTSFTSYPNWIEGLDVCQPYKTAGDNIYVTFGVNTWGYKLTYYVLHDYHPSKGYMTWTLDYSRLSDLSDSSGYWLVYPSPLDPQKTRVEYTVDVRIGGWIPGFIESYLAETGVENATQWVKRESEKRAR